MASASLETVAWLADSPDTLYKVGQALGLPGGAPPHPRSLNPLITYAGTHITYISQSKSSLTLMGTAQGARNV